MSLTLFSPVALGPVTLATRVVSTSHQTSLVHQHLPTDDLLAYHEARARGGVGAIFLEATAVDRSGLLTSHTLGGFLPAIVPAYEQLATRVHAHGTKLFVQLFHGGREQISSAPASPAVAPSAIPSLRFKTEPRALTITEIRELVGGFARAARYAADGGLDGVEVSMSHGYLAAQFFSPLSNRRADGYGGALEGRLRFAREVLAAVREAAGTGLAVGVRLSADERLPGGLDGAACAEIAQALDAGGLVDFISLVLGHSSHPAASTWIAPPPPAALNAIAEPARRIRAAVPDATIIATTRLLDLADAERMLAGHVADAVGMTRALIADPDLITKARSAELGAVIECIGCNQSCIGHYHAGLPIGCAVNPRTGRERTMARPSRSAHGRRVLVIGAGPAGLAAALEAAAAGDEVTVVERAPEFGGQLRLAAKAPAHLELWERYRRSTAARLRAAGIDLELGVTADAALATGFDLTILATGARFYAPPLPDDLPFAVEQAWNAIDDPGAITPPALIADWGGGWDGLDATERLAGAGIAVTLACAGTLPGESLHQYQRNLYLARLDELEVTVVHHTELAIAHDGVALRHVFSGRQRELAQIGTLVLAQGRAPDDELWPALEAHPGAVRAGDVLGPRTLEEAVLEGTLAVRAPA